MKTGIIFGCWDLFHVGHLRVLKKASFYCDKLYIGVFSDSVVEKYKGERPIISERDRWEIVHSLKLDCPVAAVIVNERKPQNLMVDYLFVSERLKDKKLHMIDDCFRGKVVYLEYTARISGNSIKRQIRLRTLGQKYD